MKISKIFKILGVCVSVFFLSCTAHYQDYNTNQYKATADEMARDGYNTRAALLAMQAWYFPVDINPYQFVENLCGQDLGGYLAASKTDFDKNAFTSLKPSDNWNRVPFNHIARIYTSYFELKDLTDDEIMLSIADIIRIAFMQRTTDSYGPIPYSQIGESGALNAPYDSQQAVYDAMFKELTAAIVILTENSTVKFNAFADKVFQGDVQKWIKFANTLKLRMAMRIVYVDPTKAREKAEEAVNHSIGVMMTNADNARYDLPGVTPLVHIAHSYGNTNMSADMACYLTGYADKRMEKYFSLSTFAANDGLNGGVDLAAFHGLRRGIDIPPLANKYANVHPTNLNDKIIWMVASEAAFLRAEGAMRGWNMGETAEAAYARGIDLSFEQWGATGVSEYLADDSSKPIAYTDPLGNETDATPQSTITIKWDDSATEEIKLERIITQKWIANFPLGNEAWSDFRRTGYPKLLPATFNNNVTEYDSPEKIALGLRRLKFTDEEYSSNATNVQAAAATITGGDKHISRNWWDANPRLNFN